MQYCKIIVQLGAIITQDRHCWVHFIHRKCPSMCCTIRSHSYTITWSHCVTHEYLKGYTMAATEGVFLEQQ